MIYVNGTVAVLCLLLAAVESPVRPVLAFFGIANAICVAVLLFK